MYCCSLPWLMCGPVGVCCFAGPAPTLTTLAASAIATDDFLGGLPLSASWSPALCTCAGFCKYSVSVHQSIAGGSASVLVATGLPNRAATFSTTLIPLVDGSVLHVLVRCEDVFGRRSEWLRSQGTVVVLARRVSLDCGIPQPEAQGNSTVSSGSRGLLNAFQPSTLPLTCTVRLEPPAVGNVTVSATRSYLAPNATDTFAEVTDRYQLRGSNGTLVRVSTWLCFGPRTYCATLAVSLGCTECPRVIGPAAECCVAAVVSVVSTCVHSPSTPVRVTVQLRAPTALQCRPATSCAETAQ
jgi:hypothetical protein